MSEFTYCQPGIQCFVCGGYKNCRRRTDESLHFCRYSHHGATALHDDLIYTGEGDGGLWGVYRDPSVSYDGTKHGTAKPFGINKPLISNPRLDPKAAAAEAKRQKMFNYIATHKRPITDWESRLLGRLLGLPSFVFRLLPVEYLDDDRGTTGEAASRGAWVFPEYNGQGEIAGYVLRYHDEGLKRAHGGRGLTIPQTDALNPDLPIFIPEGNTSPLALAALGFEVVGRPSSTGGVTALVEFLAQDAAAGRRLVVVADNDPKPNGTWPGLSGAKATAEKMAKALGCVVDVVLPPDGAKDARAWYGANKDNAEVMRNSVRIWCELPVEYSVSGKKEPVEVEQEAEQDVPQDATPVAAARPVKAVQHSPSAAAIPLPENSWLRQKVLPSCHHKICCKHRTENRIRIMAVACERFGCPECAPILKRRWLNSIENRLGKMTTGQPDQKLYLAYLTEAEARKVCKRICQKGGDFYRVVNYLGFLVISSTLIQDSTELVPQEALRTLRTAIEILPLTNRPITSSRGWKLDRIDDKTGEWKRLGKGIGNIPPHFTSKVFNEVLLANKCTELKDVTSVNASKGLSRVRRQWEAWIPKDWGREDVLYLYFQFTVGEWVPKDVDIGRGSGPSASKPLVDQPIEFVIT